MEPKYAEIAPWQNTQKYQIPCGSNKQEVEIMKQGN